MNYSKIISLSRKPRADIIQFLLSVGLSKATNYGTDIISLDRVVHEFMLYGPMHSMSKPFPDEEDLTSSLVWLQKNGYLFISGDDTLSMNRERGSRSSFSTHLLFSAVQGALERLNGLRPSQNTFVHTA